MVLLLNAFVAVLVFRSPLSLSRLAIPRFIDFPFILFCLWLDLQFNLPSSSSSAGAAICVCVPLSLFPMGWVPKPSAVGPSVMGIQKEEEEEEIFVIIDTHN